MSHQRQLVESALLVVRWQRGDRDALAELVKRWEKPLFYYLRRLAPTDADASELLQETWLNVYRSLGKLRDPMTLPAFLYATARNAALTRLRGMKHVEEITGDFAQEDEQLPALENAEAVHHALDQLPVLQREVLTLFFLQDLTLEEIARLLAVPIGTVKSRLHYARSALRTILLKGENHDGQNRPVSGTTPDRAGDSPGNPGRVPSRAGCNPS